MLPTLLRDECFAPITSRQVGRPLLDDLIIVTLHYTAARQTEATGEDVTQSSSCQALGSVRTLQVLKSAYRHTKNRTLSTLR